MRNITTGNIGLLLAIMLSAAMCAASYFFGGVIDFNNVGGICFPAPDTWGLPSQLSIGINWMMIAGITLFLQLLNKTYNFITTTDTVLQCSVLVLICSNVYIDTELCTSTFLGAAVLIEFFILFGCYRNKKSVAQFFIAGTVLSIASMFEYAAIPFILAIIVIGVMFKSLTFKGFCAMGMGLIAPYWIAIGFGLIDPMSMTVPELSTVLTYDFMEERHFLLWLNCGVTITLFLLCSLYNAVSMYAGNTKRRILNNSTLIFGLVACASIIFDCDNVVAYLCTVYIALSVQLANLFALHNLKHNHTTIILLLILYIGAFVGMIYKY